MTARHRFMGTVLAGGALAAMAAASGTAAAQDAPSVPAGVDVPASPQPGGDPAAAPAAASAEPAAEEIVVVGTAGAGVRRQSAAFAVTTVDRAAIEKLNPQSTADLLRIVPGITVESSGGQNGANIFVRGFPSGGDAEFVTFQLEGVPVFPPPTLSFLENSQLVRLDETLDRVEAVRGGTGPLYGAGQPGLTVNVVQKRGTDQLHGLAKVSGTDFGTIRGDGYVSGPLGHDTTALIGGYYASGNGIRDPRFTAEEGGQISANIEHKFARGSITIFGRYLNDHGQWLLPIPIAQTNGQISGYPGFDYGSGTLVGPETRVTTRNDGTRVNLANGRGAKVGSAGLNFDYEVVNEIKFRDRFNWLHGTANTTGLVPSGTPTTAGAVAAGYGSGETTATIGQLSLVNGGGVIANAANLPVAIAGIWTVGKRIDAEVNDGSFEWKHRRNTLTVGFYYAHTEAHDDWNLGNNILLTLEPNARRLNLTLADGRVATRDGFIGGSFFRENNDYGSDDYAVYVNDEWQLTDQLRVDGGFRWQEHDVDGQLANLSSADLDGNPNTLYDNGNTVFAPGFSTFRYRGNDFAGSAGLNYDYNRHLGGFLRYSRGNVFPFFDNLRSGLPQTQKVDSYEAGLKITYPFARAYVTYFHNDFTGLATTQITNGAPIVSTGGAKTDGVELEGAITPFTGFNFGFAATYLDSHYVNFFSNGGLLDDSGNQTQRQPRWSFRLAPSYEHRITEDVKASIFSSFYYTGDRYSDVENTQVLPEYVKWDLGIAATVREKLTFQVSADNLTNELGLTEGNPRVIGTQGNGAIYARPILGRSITFSAAYKF